MKRVFTLLAIAVFGSLLSFSVFAAGNSSKEISTALMHAHFSAASTSLDMAHTHLHHVLNCVVGPKGKAFDAKAMDPCKGMGNGALPDAGMNRAVRRDLMKAVRSAERGLKTTSLSAAHKAADQTAAALKAAESASK